MLSNYERCFAHEPLLIWQLHAVLEWPAEVPAGLVIPVAVRLFPALPWGQPAYASRDGVCRCAVHALRRAACVLHGSLLAGSSPDCIRRNCA